MNKLRLAEFRENMPIIQQKLYFDHAAMSPLHDDVVKRLNDFHVSRQINGPQFQKWWQWVEDTRVLIANWLNTSSRRIAFLGNTSAGINLAAQAFPLKEGDEVIIPEQEFPSNVYPWIHIEKNRGITLKQVKYTDNCLTAEQIIAQVTPKTKLISVSWISAHNGNVIDIEKLGRYCKENRIYFVVDAIQGFGVNNLDLSKVHIDLLVSGFYKWSMGPDGVSFIYVNAEVQNEMKVPWIGWASMTNRFNYEEIDYDISMDARRFETGNMNFSAIAGVQEALQLLLPFKEEIHDRVSFLTRQLRAGLSTIPGIQVSSPNNLYSGITLFQGKDKSQFEEENITVNFRSGVRVSPHFYNLEAEIDLFLNKMDMM
ncbi:aminotransferase class V-fold PLP-dependent enzyme [Planococcus lenghuensis]|uniref:Aminotransferase class V domain-containing protein n=1 Tax=Planococcus lenghuensis TaxID=2213202 RepID=A0A1Q2L5C1_9BACL|nr:aminotransferase class V-fold PLP-dependent enzyme [Planococcus lenghuensis]AQQ55616.1 hypothetical protein B0X71_20805 [Planococcus lenghuensis]